MVWSNEGMKRVRINLSIKTIRLLKISKGHELQKYKMVRIIESIEEFQLLKLWEGLNWRVLKGLNYCKY